MKQLLQLNLLIREKELNDVAHFQTSSSVSLQSRHHFLRAYVKNERVAFIRADQERVTL